MKKLTALLITFGVLLAGLLGAAPASAAPAPTGITAAAANPSVQEWGNSANSSHTLYAYYNNQWQFDLDPGDVSMYDVREGETAWSMNVRGQSYRVAHNGGAWSTTCFNGPVAAYKPSKTWTKVWWKTYSEDGCHN